jgi:hypothetical protein
MAGEKLSTQICAASGPLSVGSYQYFISLKPKLASHLIVSSKEELGIILKGTSS